MGRQIRKVPKNWEHPKDEDGYHIPQYDRTYEQARKEYDRKVQTWEDGTHHRLIANPSLKAKYPHYSDYDSYMPSPRLYRKEYEQSADCFQIYETVTEGTPVSPVFESMEDMKEWLVGKGYSEKAIAIFFQKQSAPTFVNLAEEGIKAGIESLPYLES